MESLHIMFLPNPHNLYCCILLASVGNYLVLTGALKSTETTEIEEESNDTEGSYKDEEQTNISGIVAEPGWYPYQVALYHDHYKSIRFFCGGSIIGKYYVLTSAHCTVNKIRVMIVAGSTSRKNYNLKKYTQSRNSTKIIIHHKYNYESMYQSHDISIIVVEEPFRFNSHVQPIPIPNNPPKSKYCVVTGWGTTNPRRKEVPDDLRVIFVQLKDRKFCVKWYNGFPNGMICSGFIKDQDYCFGDSGSPLSCRSEIQGIVSSFVSHLGNTCAKGANVYTKVYDYRHWIASNINEYYYRSKQDKNMGISFIKYVCIMLQQFLFIKSFYPY